MIQSAWGIDMEGLGETELKIIESLILQSTTETHGIYLIKLPIEWSRNQASFGQLDFTILFSLVFKWMKEKQHTMLFATSQILLRQLGICDSKVPKRLI